MQMQLGCLLVDQCLRILSESQLYHVNIFAIMLLFSSHTDYISVPVGLPILPTVLLSTPECKIHSLPFLCVVAQISESYNYPIPSGIAVPAWAYLDVEVISYTHATEVL